MARTKDWDGRVNIGYKPSVDQRTYQVIEYVIEKYGIGRGEAIEKLIKTDGLYQEAIKELSIIFPSIAKN